MLESLRIFFRKDYCAARPQSGFGNPLVWRHLLLTFIFLSLCLSQTSFAEISSVNSQKEKSTLPKWDTISNMIHGFAEVGYGPKFLGDERTDKYEFNLLEERLQLKATYRPAKPEWLASRNP